MAFSWWYTTIPFYQTLYRNVLSREARLDDSIDNWTNHARFHGVAAAITMGWLWINSTARSLAVNAEVTKRLTMLIGLEMAQMGLRYTSSLMA